MAAATFYEQVWKLLRTVPAGKVTTYGDLAHALNCSAYRAVGSAMRCNPDIPKTPCHRVVSSDGKLGGYAHGLDRKKELLASEGVLVKDGKIVDFESKRFQFH